MQPAAVREPSIHVDEALGPGPEAVIRDDEGDDARTGRGDELAERRIELAEDRARGGGDLRDDLCAHAGGAGCREVAPEEVLDPVGLVEDDREELPRALAHQPERDREPLLGEVAEPHEVGEALLAITRIAGEELAGGLDRDFVAVAEERPELRRVDHVAVGGRRHQAGDHEAVHGAHGIRRWNVDRADRTARVTDDLPQRPRADLVRGDEIAAPVPGGREPSEAEYTVLARILAGHERRPGGRREGRERRAELAMAAAGHQARELGHLARGRPGTEGPERRPVEPDHQDPSLR